MSHKKHKILLVDDDPGNLNFLRLAFRDDFLVLMARNGGASSTRPSWDTTGSGKFLTAWDSDTFP